MEPAASLRSKLLEASRAGVTGCSARGPEGDNSPPIAVCARHKALAIDAELEALACNEESLLIQLDAACDAAIATAELLADQARSVAAEVRATTATKRAALACATDIKGAATLANCTNGAMRT